MPRKRHKPEEIVAKLRQVDVLTSQGKSVADAIRSIGVTEVTYYRWKQEYGGLKTDQVRRLKELEQENTRLRKAVSDLTLDKLILQEAAKLPMRDVWENWNKSRPKSDRDADGMELWRAVTYHELTDSWRGAEVFKWAAHKQRTAYADLLLTKIKPVKLKYESLVRSVLGWLQFLHPSEHEFDTRLDIAETLFSFIPETDLKDLVPKPKSAKKGKSEDDDDDDNEKDWRRNELFEHWLPDGHIGTNRSGQAHGESGALRGVRDDVTRCEPLCTGPSTIAIMSRRHKENVAAHKFYLRSPMPQGRVSLTNKQSRLAIFSPSE